MAELELRGDLPTLLPGAPRTPAGGVKPPGPVTPVGPTGPEGTPAGLLETLILNAPIGIAFLDRDLRYLRINETLAAANGLPVADHLGRTVAEVLPDLAPDVVPLLQRVLDTGEPLTGLRLQTGATPAQPGRRRTWSVSYYPIVSAGEAASTVEGVGLIVTDETDRIEADEQRRMLLHAEHAASLRAVQAAAAAQESARRQQLLQQVTARLAPAMTRRDVASVVTSLGRQLFGITVAVLLEYDDELEQLTLLSAPDGEEPQRARQPLPLAAYPNAAEAIRTCSPVVFGSRAERDRRFPGMAAADIPFEAWAVLPMVSRGRPIGVAAFGWEAARETTPDELALLSALATQSTTALERIHLYESAQEARDAAEQARSRLDILARAGEALGGSLDEDEVLQRLCGLLVPELTDWLMVLLPDGRGRLAPRVTVFADPAMAQAARHVLNGPAFPVSSPIPPAVAFRTRKPLIVDDVALHAARGDFPAEIAEATASMRPGPGLLVPMLTRDRTVGVLSLVNCRDDEGAPPRRRTRLHEDVDLVTDLARRAAVALDNAGLFGRSTRIATRLQDTLLPAQLPTVPGAVVAARYATAEEAVEVGGDFYDVVPLPGEDRMLVIGDVSGRGIEAAGTTGLARHTLRALARDSSSPGRALTRLNDVLVDEQRGDLAGERFLTAVCARYRRHPAGALLRVARAGHTHPLVVRADGDTEFLRPAGELLGALPEVHLDEVDVLLRPGDSVVLHTDGIIETRVGDEEFGEQRLAAAAAACVRAPGFTTGGADAADALADAVLAAVTEFEAEPGGDDRALLVVHVTG